ncbi:transmembrane channel-like protein 1 isoform X2 [Stegodyphus dumicola]|uniref:transmembrane channel-like protein 1 isoform X2 n=1 Tax=Stegodyphus dumicola TaxID=202533 RepID=UPI0015AD7E16|nr:transmembrane channel-like protein 1 isoform X2 [Stegodyphus dumicola]
MSDTAISIEEEETPEEVKENMRLNKQIIETIKLQPWRMKKKYKILRKAKAYVRKHEGELAQSKRSKDVFAKYRLWWSRGLNRFKREVANFMVMLTPWEMRIKRIESHFGSVVASYFTFLRWVFWINCFISAFVCCFLMVPEVLRGAEDPTGMRKEIESDEKESALNLKNIWDFEGYLKYSPIFYGYYSNREKTEEGYRVPLAYFLTSISVYCFSFFAILRRMAENSRMSKLSEKDDECTFAWKLFTGWDYMIGNPETAYNKVASLVMGFKEAILEEKEKKKEVKSWKLIAVRVAANFAVFILLASSAYAVVLVVTRSQEPEAQEGGSWYRQNEVTLVVSFISLLFPNLFDMIGIAEKYHPRVQLRWQLARILLLYLLNLYTLIFALFAKVYKTTDELAVLAKNITETIDAQNASLRHTRSLLEIKEDLTESTTLLSPYNCTFIIIYNCTLAALYSSLNLTDFPLTTTAFPSNMTAVDGDYFLDNSTTENDLHHILHVANLTAAALNSTTDNSSLVFVNIIHVPKDNNNNSHSMLPNSSPYVDTDKIQWVIPLDLISEIPNNWTTFENFNESLSTLVPLLSTAFLLNETTTTESPAEDDDSTTTDSGWPPELNCTVMIPVCFPSPDFTTEDSDLASTTEGFDSTTSDDDFDLTLNGTDSSENATSVRPCAGIIPDEDAPCPKKCMKEEKKHRMPTQEDLLNIPDSTKDLLRKKCWETAFGQELVKLTVMDLVMTVISTILTDFLRAVFVRYANNCWCWDLEKGFPGYGDFKIAENILHLVNNQGLVWMGMFFSPGLPAINTVKLCILVYVRSWAVLTANIPHETVFRASRSNNFYYALLLIMLFLCTLPVGFACVWLEPSWHCGPFSEQKRIYNVLTSYVLSALPSFMVDVVKYLTSPGVVIPLLLLLILIIYYLFSLTGSLREANNDLKMQLRREKSEKEKPPKTEEKPPEAVELPDDLTKWSSAKKIIPVLPNKFRPSSQLLGDDSDDSHDTPSKKSKRIQSSDEQYVGTEDKKAHREEHGYHKDRIGRRPSPMSTESHRSSSEGDDRKWIRRGGITGNGDLPLITISQASEGRDSPGQLSSLNSSEEATPPSSITSRRRPGLIPSVSEQEEDLYVEEEEDEDLTIEIRDHTHFEPIRDAQENGEQEEVAFTPEMLPSLRDTAETKGLTGCARPRIRHMDESSSTEPEYDDYCNKSTLPMDSCPNKRGLPSSRSGRQSSLQRSKAVKGSDSLGSTDSNTLRPPSPEPEVRRAKIQRLDTDSL